MAKMVKMYVLLKYVCIFFRWFRLRKSSDKRMVPVRQVHESNDERAAARHDVHLSSRSAERDMRASSWRSAGVLDNKKES